MKIEVHGLPPIGSRLLIDLQEYRLVRLDDYTRRDGSMTKLGAWATHCPKCGDPFEAITTGLAKAPQRRCPPCAKVAGNTRVLPRKGKTTAILELRSE